MAKIFIEESTLSAIGDSIRAKTGKTDMIPPLNMPTEIASIQTGGSSALAASNDVTFYDYDGTVVASYSLEEAQALTSLPDGPTHEGLTFQGWNWSLENVNALTRPMNVGAMYITDDGKTRLYIHIADKARSTVPLYFSQTVEKGVTIDWGDGSATETIAGTGNVNASHAYGKAGDFMISLAVADGCTLGLGHGSSSYCVMGSTENNGKVYCNTLQKVEIGSEVTKIGSYSFRYCYSLSSITIPDGVNSIGDYAFQYCYSLSGITIPYGVTNISSYTFQNCYSVSIIAIPNGVTEIGTYAFRSCYSLSSVTIPDGITSIENNALSYCQSLSSIIIPDGVTKIGGFAFMSCNSLSSIKIPDGVTTIAANSFQYCYSLSNVTIPNGLIYLDDYAFGDCFGVAEYHIKPTTPPTMMTSVVFNNIPSDCIIYVPQGCLEAYQTATNWTRYASYMQEEP